MYILYLVLWKKMLFIHIPKYSLTSYKHNGILNVDELPKTVGA